ncbi:MAG: Gfo/Idh/MocA family oxidoreductase, partial [Spirochaetota bacterium]
HEKLSIAALKAGKHVLCEKPLALNYAEARRMVVAARNSGLQNMVNFSYRDAPALQHARQLVSDGVIGEVLHLEARYLQSWLSSRVWGDWRSDPAWLWRLSSQHGSKGVLGDIGVHILDFASYPVERQTGPIEAVHCTLQTFSGVKGEQLGEYTLDANDSAVINARFANGALASIHTSRWATGHINALYLGVYGTKGGIKIDLDESPDMLRLCDEQHKDQAQWQMLSCPPTPNNYERFVRSIRTGRAEAPDFGRGAEIQKLLDACFSSHAERGRLQEV